MLTATSQRAAEAFTVSPFASDAPNDSQRSLWCKPDSGVPLSALQGPAAALALVAPQTPRHTARNRPFARAVRTAPGLVHTKLDRGLRCLALPLRPDSTASASRRCARVSPRAAESHTWKPLPSITQPPDVPGTLSLMHTIHELSLIIYRRPSSEVW